MESGGDMSITNSNSNFSNTSLHAIGLKVSPSTKTRVDILLILFHHKLFQKQLEIPRKNAYYTIDVKASNDPNNHTKVYLGNDDGFDPAKRPAAIY